MQEIFMYDSENDDIISLNNTSSLFSDFTTAVTTQHQNSTYISEAQKLCLWPSFFPLLRLLQRISFPDKKPDSNKINKLCFIKAWG